MNWLPWAPLCAATLHIFEEFVWPGGFSAWYRRYKPERAKSITPRFLVIINILFLILCYDAGAARSQPFGPALWLTVAALLAGNAVWHLIGAMKTRSYSPGLVTGLLLYIPLAVVGYVHLLSSGTVVIGTAAVAAALGGSYHWWSAAFHGVRARRAPSSRSD